MFAGGFGLAAAEAVTAGPDVPAEEVAGHLGALVDKSLVQFGDAGAGPGRYRLLETVRRYAAGRLDARGPAAADGARAAHHDYFLALAEAAARGWWSPIKPPGSTGSMPSMHAAGDHAAAARDAAEALRLSRQTGDLLQIGQMLGNLGSIELSAGDLDAARGHLAESLDVLRALNDRSGIVYETFNLAMAEYLTGSPDAAEALFAESLDRARRIGLKALVAYALIGLALAGHGRSGQVGAGLAAADPSWSARLHGAADQVFADLNETIEPLQGRLADLDRQRLRDAMGAEAFEAEYAAGRTLDLTEVLATLARTDPPAEKAAVTKSSGAASVLTPRELDVLTLVAQGLSNPEIARRLVLSEHTVHRHLANILRKLDLSSRAAAAAWGVRTGLV